MILRAAHEPQMLRLSSRNLIGNFCSFEGQQQPESLGTAAGSAAAARELGTAAGRRKHLAGGVRLPGT